MITKPEDARPRVMIDYPKYPHFTAAECAEIAKAYADCIAAEMMTFGWQGEAWRAKFKEWDQGQ